VGLFLGIELEDTAIDIGCFKITDATKSTNVRIAKFR